MATVARFDVGGLGVAEPGGGPLSPPMPVIWALSDLHLSTSGSKPMDKFGDHWGNHAGRMAEAWDRLVADEDIVLTPGDFSWANKPAEAAGDLAWLGARPGHKVMVKGNHDHWWAGTQAKLAQMLPPRTYALKKTACVIGGVGFFGARGGDFAPLTRYGDERTAADIEEWLAREERELVQSIAALDQLDAAAGRPRGLRVCLFHYPPIPPGRQASRFTGLIEAAGASQCVYGHLHGRDVGATKVEGTFNGVTYRCASCDQIDFAPTEICRF
jgi:predicted phosphohydrolase